jgi:hypothetical protein
MQLALWQALLLQGQQALRKVTVHNCCMSVMILIFQHEVESTIKKIASLSRPSPKYALSLSSA